MIRGAKGQEPVERNAIFSECRRYRYTLSRIWKPSVGYALFVCLNPSTADESTDDPTIRRCIGFAKKWGYGGMVMANLFAWRATCPKALYEAADPVGDENDFWIMTESHNAAITVAAWGTHGIYMRRGYKVMGMLHDPHYLALTKHGFPGHPLYLRNTLRPRRV